MKKNVYTKNEYVNETLIWSKQKCCTSLKIHNMPLILKYGRYLEY